MDTPPLAISGDPFRPESEQDTGGGGLPPLAADPRDEAGPQAGPATPRRMRENAGSKPTPRAKWGRVTVELPEYLIDDLKLRALKNHTSLRFIVMKALRTLNFRILDADMIEDARKANGRKRAA